MMPKCNVCGQEVDVGVQVCPECGTELGVQAGVGASPEEQKMEVTPAMVSPPVPAPTLAAPEIAKAARLCIVLGGIPTGREFSIGGQVVVGRFDPEKGPVDIDLSSLPGSEYVSRHHAQIYPDPSGQWFVIDLGSSNGTFIKPAGSPQFQRIPENQPVPINDGDEIAFGGVRCIFRT